MDAAARWFRSEFEITRRRVREGFDTIEPLFRQPDTPPVKMRAAFADIAFNLKYLLALLHFERSHAESLIREGRLIGTLAWLEGTPVSRPAWQRALGELKAEFEAVEAHPPGFEDELNRTSLEAPHDMYVTGPDRVTEGEGEMDFDIPEASVADQIRNEIANLANKIMTRLPHAG